MLQKRETNEKQELRVKTGLEDERNGLQASNFFKWKCFLLLKCFLVSLVLVAYKLVAYKKGSCSNEIQISPKYAICCSNKCHLQYIKGYLRLYLICGENLEVFFDVILVTLIFNIVH